MKKIYSILVLLFIGAILFSGCSSGSSGGHKNDPIGKKYSIHFTVGGGENIEMSMQKKQNTNNSVFAAEEVPKTADWWKVRIETDFLSYCNFNTRPIWGPTAVQVWIRNESTGELINMTAEDAENYITWTSPNEANFDLTGDINMTGYSVGFNPHNPGIFTFTASFYNANYVSEPLIKTCQVVVLNSPKIDPFNISANLGAGYSFSTHSDTNNPVDWDITYQNIDGQNYIIAPYGIEKVCDMGNDGIDEGWSLTRLGSIIQNPSGLTFVNTKLICEQFTYYIIKTKNGGYAKIMNLLWSTDSTNKIVKICYEYSVNGIYEYHW
jgi:hypothetical protein